MCGDTEGPTAASMTAISSTLGVLSALLAFTNQAHAEDTGEAGDVTPLSPEALAGAEDAGVISKRALNDLEPKRSRLPNNPYTHTDFTAYSLELGEVRLGLGQIKAGILPRTQIGTAPVALTIGALNGHAKVDFLRLGPVDVAATGSHYRYTREGFTANHSQLGGTTSVQVLPKWSMHFSGRWQNTHAQGVPNLDQNPWLLDMVAPDIDQRVDAPATPDDATRDQAFSAVQNEYGDDQLTAQAVTLKVATDLRLNRRDSIILQAQANVWSSFESSMDLETLAAEDRWAAMAIDNLQAEGIANTYVTSVAWHFSWHRADLRLGAGLSSTPGAWVTQTADFAWRFGGPTRRSETRMTRSWKNNRKDLRRASFRNAPAPEAT